MLQQVQAVVSTELPLYGVLMPDVTILPITSDGILIHVGVIRHTDLCAEEVGSKLAIHSCWYPALPEVEVQVGKGYRPWACCHKSRQTLFPFLVVGVVKEPRGEPISFLDHVARDELIGYLIATCLGIVVNTSLEGRDDVALLHLGK